MPASERASARTFVTGPPFPYPVPLSDDAPSRLVPGRSIRVDLVLLPGARRDAAGWAARGRHHDDATAHALGGNSTCSPSHAVLAPDQPLQRLCRSVVGAVGGGALDKRNPDVDGGLVGALWGSWAAMRTTLASVALSSARDTAPSETTPHPHCHQSQHHCHDHAVGQASGPARATSASAASASGAGSTTVSDGGAGAASTNSVNGGAGGGGGGWAAGGGDRAAAATRRPQALFSLARAGDGVGGALQWTAPSVSARSGAAAATGAHTAAAPGAGAAAAAGGVGVGGGVGGGAQREVELDVAAAEATLADLVRRGDGSWLGDSSDEGQVDDAEAAASALASVECGFCRRRLGRRAASGRGPRLLLCDGCHRPFHADCCRYRGVPTRRQRQDGSGGGGGGWFHNKECEACAAQWRQRAAAGPLPAAGGCSVALLPSGVDAAAGSGGRGASDGEGPSRQDVTEGLREVRRRRWRRGRIPALQIFPRWQSASEYGPRAVDAVLDSDYAVLLRDPRGTAVAAATLDVYGREVTVTDLLATAEAARGRGHCRALVDSLDGWLQEAGSRNWVVALPPGPEGKAAQRVWRERGFRPVGRGQARAWSRQLPGFPELAPWFSRGGGGDDVMGGGGRGSLLMVRVMGEEGGGEGEGEGARGGGRGAARGAVVAVARGVWGGVAGAVRGVVGYVMLSGR